MSTTYGVSVTERLKISQPGGAVKATYHLSLSGLLKVYRADSYIVARAILLRDTLAIRPTTTRLYQAVAALRSTLRLRPTLGAGSKLKIALRSSLALKAALNVGSRVSLRSVLSLHPTASVTVATALRSVLRLATTTAIKSFYTTSLRHSLRLKESKPYFHLGGFLTSRVALHPTLTRTYRAVAATSAILRLTSTLTPKLRIVIVSSSRITLSGTAALRGIYRGTLSDTVDFLLDTVDPSGDVTTWAVNVRTGAVTEYLNYAFNSFALSPSGSYLGARPDGLYELVGPDDAGSSIVADLISGLADFSGSFLTGFKAAYLGLRGSGQFYLKLTSGDGKAYVYGVQADNLKTTRVNIGKGLRARYFTFELLSTGQDFDLTDITFVPVQSTRRV